jgi:predicted nucleic acid-binding protein
MSFATSMARRKRSPPVASAAERGGRSSVPWSCDLVILELTRLAPNEVRAREVSDRLAAFEAISMPAGLWDRARRTQLALSANGDGRRVPPVDLLMAAAAEVADVDLVHYDRDYDRIAAVGALRQEWLVPDGTLA